uniref:Uncharacterized protein n=1 Tax=Arundo donax TaxID=35708 RepID=A0A0A8ZGY6_ARUDO
MLQHDSSRTFVDVANCVLSVLWSLLPLFGLTIVFQ